MKKIFIAILALVAVTVSCNKEQPLGTPENGSNVEQIVSEYPLIKAVMPQTKTYLDGTQLKFKTGDIITVFNGNVSDEDHYGPNHYRCVDITDGVATFAWSEHSAYTPADDVEVIVATFPNGSKTTMKFEEFGEGTVKIRIRPTESNQENQFDEMYFAPQSMPVIASAAPGEMLQFKHTVGLLKMTVKGSGSINKITIQSDEIIAGYGSVNYNDAAPVLEMKGLQGNENDYKFTYIYSKSVQEGQENDAVTTTVNGPELTEEGTDFYFGLPVGTRDYTFTFIDANGKTMQKTAKGLAIERATITTSTLVYTPDAGINLSPAGKYANCYVVSKGGTYMFDAKKPNGELVTGTSADWVWASGEACNDSNANTLPSAFMSDINYENGKIVFTVPASMKYGNVVLALLDANKNIQYTWHIWLTESGMADITVGNVTVMDRNLGATNVYDVSVAANAPLQGGKGNFYQWGRKDPILGGRNSVGDAGGEATAFGTTNSQYYDINVGAQIVNVSAWEYNKTFSETTQEAGSAYPLTMGASKNVPGYDENSTAAWCDRPNANPCPYGYRVINASEFTSLIESGLETSYYNNFAQFTLGGDTKVYFPRAGYRRGDNGKADQGQTYGRYYLNDLGGGSVNQQGQEYQIIWTSAKEYSKYKLEKYTNAYNALSVRCVKVTE